MLVDKQFAESFKAQAKGNFSFLAPVDATKLSSFRIAIRPESEAQAFKRAINDVLAQAMRG